MLLARRKGTIVLHLPANSLLRNTAVREAIFAFLVFVAVVSFGLCYVLPHCFPKYL